MRKIPNYKLYYSKEDCIIKLEKQKGNVLTVDETLDTTDVIHFNNYYYLSDNRNALVDKAIELRDEWIKEHEESIKKLITVNYKKKGGADNDY